MNILIHGWRHLCESFCIMLCVLVLEYQNTHFTSKVRTFVGRGCILVGPHNLKGLSVFVCVLGHRGGGLW